MIELINLGFGDYLKRTNEKINQGEQAARVISEQKSTYKIVSEKGIENATLPRVFHHKMNKLDLPKVGDWITLGEDGKISRILPRFSSLTRNKGEDATQQIIVTNIHTALIVIVADIHFNMTKVSSYVSAVKEAGIDPIIVLNKVDTFPPSNEDLGILKNLHIKIIETSATTSRNLDKLINMLKPYTSTVLIGPSGVGKSSLVNALLKSELLKVGSTREKDGQGKHTSSSRELIILPNQAIIIDTPGTRTFASEVSLESINESLPDLAELAMQCRFTNCDHEKSTGCAIVEAVKEGKISNKIYKLYISSIRQVKSKDIVKEKSGRRKTQKLIRAYKKRRV